jgi:hypothetical protein
MTDYVEMLQKLHNSINKSEQLQQRIHENLIELGDLIATSRRLKQKHDECVSLEMPAGVINVVSQIDLSPGRLSLKLRACQNRGS